MEQLIFTHSLTNLNKKNSIDLTPLNCLLKAFIGSTSKLVELCVQMKKAIQEGYFALVELFLSEFILQHFKLKEVCKEQEVLHLELEEVNAPPEDLLSEQLLSKGFFRI